MQIVIFGGSGFLGKGITEKLITDDKHQVIIVSRHEKPDYADEKIQWVKSDLNTDTKWHEAVNNADWVINCIGILLPNWSKKITYHKGIVKPAKIIIDYLKTLDEDTRPKFMYISAKKAPFFLAAYMHAKKQVEKFTDQLPTDQVKIIYPPVMYHQTRGYSVILAMFTNLALLIPGFGQLLSGYEPVKRDYVAEQIKIVIDGGNSKLTQR